MHAALKDPDFMGKAMVIYRIYPEEDYNLAKLVSDINKVDKVKAVQREPVAFGLEVLKVGALVDDKLDKPEDVENALRKVQGVKEIECLDVTLIS
jgi:translation elongation factor EF-1beta